MRTVRPYHAINVCERCETHTLYELHKECDHNDGHVLMPDITETACDQCHEVFHLAQDGELRTWFSPVTGQNYLSEEELLEVDI